MASRRQIRESFYSELESAVPSSGDSGHVPSNSIKDERPESLEDLPSIEHDDDYRKRPINQASDAPISVNRDTNGDATGEVFGTLHEARFSILFWFIDEDEKEDCYESVRTYFEKFENQSVWPASDIQSDVQWVRVRDATSENDAEIDPTRHGDRLLVSLVFLRTQENTDSAIQQADTELDADNDGTTETTFTTT